MENKKELSMATRTFCDHCGLKIPTPKRFFFGRYQDTTDTSQQGYAGSLGGQSVSQALKQAIVNQSSRPAERYYPTIVVDLCEICAPIWYERAVNLTKATKEE
jgi:hypothetical protein